MPCPCHIRRTSIFPHTYFAIAICPKNKIETQTNLHESGDSGSMTSATAGWLVGCCCWCGCCEALQSPPVPKILRTPPYNAGREDRQRIFGWKDGKIGRSGASYKSQTALIHKATSKTATAAPIFPFTTTPKDDSPEFKRHATASSHFAQEKAEECATGPLSCLHPGSMCIDSIDSCFSEFVPGLPGWDGRCLAWLARFTSTATEYFAPLDKRIIYYGNWVSKQ